MIMVTKRSVVVSGDSPEEVIAKIERLGLHFSPNRDVYTLEKGARYFCLAVDDGTGFSDNGITSPAVYDRNTVAVLLDLYGRKGAEEEFFGPASKDTNDSTDRDTLDSILGLPSQPEMLSWFKEFGIPETAATFEVTPRALFRAYDFTHKELRGAAGYSEGRTELNDGVAQNLGLNSEAELRTLLSYDK